MQTERERQCGLKCFISEAVQLAHETMQSLFCDADVCEGHNDVDQDGKQSKLDVTNAPVVLM